MRTISLTLDERDMFCFLAALAESENRHYSEATEGKDQVMSLMLSTIADHERELMRRIEILWDEAK